MSDWFKSAAVTVFSNIKVYLIAAGVLLAMLIGAALVWGVMHAENAALSESLKDANAALAAEKVAHEADSAAAQVSDKLRAANTQRAKERTIELASAVAANPEWGSQLVPAAVADSLRDASAVSGP